MKATSAMTIEQMSFKGEEIVVRKETVKKTDTDVFANSGMPHEKDGYGIFKVVKVGRKQNDYCEDDIVLINQNGLPKEITIEGQPTIKDHYVFGNSSRIFCSVNE